MSKAVYKNLNETDNLQTNIMLFVSWWAKTKRTPTPRKEIMDQLYKNKIGRGTAEASLHALIIKGYIRKANTISNKTSYVQLRTV